MSRIIILCLAVLCVPCLSASAAELPPVESPAPTAINDKRLHDSIIKSAGLLISAGKTTKVSQLIGQLGQKTCSLKLPKTSHKECPVKQVYSQNCPGVLVIGSIYKCDKCNNWHATCASGFVLSESGAAVTNYHVVNSPKNETLVAATFDGKVLPVQSVLAASEDDDIAIVQLGGDQLQPLALAADAPVGSHVSAISHPDGQYYTLTEGVLSRYCMRTLKTREVQQMAITADFARGSSGGPIFDECGNAIGMVASTVSIYYTVDGNKKDNLQMVLKHCVPAASILKLIEPAK